MVKFGVADYGVDVWEGGNYCLEQRLLKLREIGYDGIERLKGQDLSEAFNNAITFHRNGMDFACADMPTPEFTFRCAAAFGKSYVWMPSKGRENLDIDVYCRRCRVFAEAGAYYGVKCALHNHMGNRIESQEELEYFMKEVPQATLLLDVGHLAGVGGDNLYILEKYFDRLSSIHLKGVVKKDMDAPMSTWWNKYRLCSILEDQLGIDFKGILKILKKRNYDGWILVEHDTHLRSPYEDLKEALDYIKANF